MPKSSSFTTQFSQASLPNQSSKLSKSFSASNPVLSSFMPTWRYFLPDYHVSIDLRSPSKTICCYLPKQIRQ